MKFSESQYVFLCRFDGKFGQRHPGRCTVLKDQKVKHKILMIPKESFQIIENCSDTNNIDTGDNNALLLY